MDFKSPIQQARKTPRGFANSKPSTAMQSIFGVNKPPFCVFYNFDS